ncbi:hypothetical protein DIURU_000522 [Diutina rugosa]|uniref:Translocation protein SEC62 n=1 Tax=Diutina rugosa TaxID=5481 RepID=A0A642UY17_DIURU|nr:uncharacterized protein DIURU_000522 [Diutina rugosa]KAA8907515.1 hypothetical protein DIURU_000522 [Diutina rugosa]
MSQPAAKPAAPVQSQQVKVETEQRSPIAIALARWLKDHRDLKQRVGLLNNEQDISFFRYKRFRRLLTSDVYKKAQQNPKNGLIPIEADVDADKAFVLLIQNQMIVPVQKLHWAEIKAVRGWKPNRQKPTLKRINEARVDPDSYFAWTYQKPNPYAPLLALLFIAAVFTVILFPLWPNFMKRGVWYLSMGALGLIGCFFGIAIVRLIVYVITALTMPRGLWLFPNLFEDCGVIESFQPAYGWEKERKKKGKKKSKGTAAAATPGASAPAPATSTKANSASTPVSVGSDKQAASGAAAGQSLPTKRKVTLEEVDE